jgi:hypothetical protein
MERKTEIKKIKGKEKEKKWQEYAKSVKNSKRCGKDIQNSDNDSKKWQR